MVAQSIERIEVPQALLPMLEPHRYKVVSGGRGSGKSWTFARLLILRALERPITIICAREIQRSIRDSVHQLLVNQIDRMGLASQFSVGETEINARNGSRIIYRGLLRNTSALKSTEGVSICWVTQGETVSQRSWDDLFPTIRDPGSEIWVDLNPDSPDDPIYQMAVEHRLPGEWYAHVTWRDNPWFPAVLETERRHMLTANRAKHDHIYGGLPLLLTELRVFRPDEANYYDPPSLDRWCQAQHPDYLRLAGGLDFGFEDADSCVVLVYSVSPAYPQIWVLEEYKERRESITELAEAIRGIEARVVTFVARHQFAYPELSLQSDFGGGGKQIAYELYRQHNIRCFEPAIKTNRLMAIDLLRDDVHEHRLMISRGGALDEEMRKTVWMRDDRDRIVREIDDNLYHPDALYATVYAMRPMWGRLGRLAPGENEAPMMQAKQRKLVESGSTYLTPNFVEGLKRGQ